MKGLKPVNFHSRVLTPILQRQLGGVFDVYSPTVCTGINSTVAMLSIQDVIEFDLQVDPVDPVFIQSYHQNLLYLPEPCWQLELTMGVASSSDEAAINHY